MGKLRHEVQVDKANGPGPRQRFQPPRRRDRQPPRCPSEPSCGGTRPGSEPSSGDRGARPGSEAEACTGDRAPSVEMAWLLRAQSRMEEDEEEVDAFLARHELSRYAPLLAEDTEGLGASLEALRKADDADLAKAGFPALARAQLLKALAEEHYCQGEDAAAADEGPQFVVSAEAAGPASQNWGCLGQVPPGWRRMQPSGADGQEVVVLTRAHPTTRVDSGCGDDEPLPEEAYASMIERSPSVFAAQPEVEILDPLGPVATLIVPLPPSRPATGSRPSSRPGSKAGTRPTTAESGTGTRPSTAERPSTASTKVCCYQCYRQVYAASAIAEEEASVNVTRQFCGESCADKYRQALAARETRERNLEELRRVKLQSRDGCEAEADQVLSPGATNLPTAIA